MIRNTDRNRRIFELVSLKFPEIFIADMYGLSRERIRQIKVVESKKRNNREIIKPIFVRHIEACKLLKIGFYKLDQLILKNGIEFKRLGKSKFLYVSDIETLKKVCLPRICKICNRELPSSRSRYCSDKCFKESVRYVNRSDRYKILHYIAVRQWATEHPDEIKRIAKKATERYRLKEKATTNLKRLLGLIRYRVVHDYNDFKEGDHIYEGEHRQKLCGIIINKKYIPYCCLVREDLIEGEWKLKRA